MSWKAMIVKDWSGDHVRGGEKWEKGTQGEPRRSHCSNLSVKEPQAAAKV